jgi:hypothetical protein
MTNQYNADSLFLIGDYKNAIEKYKLCLNSTDAQKINYYYLASCFSKTNLIDSSYYYFKKYIDQNVHFLSLNDTNYFLTDSNIKSLLEHNNFDSLNCVIIQNTKLYFSNYFYDSILSNEIIRKGFLDQMYRKDENFHDSISKIMRKQIDVSNTMWLDSIINARNCWFKKQEVGSDAAKTAFLILQHSQSLELQKKCLTLMKELYYTSEVDVLHLAYLQDRILDKEEKKQIYGTQFDSFGNMLPVQDSLNLDKYRLFIGLPSVEETNKAIQEYKKSQKNN